MKFRAFALFVSGLLLMVSCSASSSSGPSLEGLIRQDTDSGLKPLDNGFSFANFGSNISTEQFDVNDLVLMFGASACVDGITEPCAPTAQASAWARMVNDARQSGHCEGLVVQASARFNESAQPTTSDLPRDTDVIHGVFRAFATQFLPEVQDSAKQWSNRSLVEIANELNESLKNGVTKYSMGLYSDQGGHAVLPYAISFSSDTMAVIKVYDSNWPGMERYVVIDFAEDKWFFSFSDRDQQADDCVWSGGPGDIDLTPLDSRTNAQCPFCGDKTTVTKSMLLIRSTSNDWSVTTDEGTFTPSDMNQVEGITSRAIRTSTCDEKTKLPEFLIATTSYRVTITLPDDSSAYISNGRSVVEVQTTGKKERKPIVVDRDEVLIDDEDTVTTVSNGDLAAVVQAPQARISLVNDNIEVSVNSGSTTESIVIDRNAPRQSISTRGEQVVVEDATDRTTTIEPTVPENLQQDAQPASLPPTSERDLSNPEYVEDVVSATTTTTQAPVTTQATVRTTLPRSSTTTTTNAPSAAAAPTTTASTSTSTTTTTTTIPSVTIRIVIEDGEGGIRYTIRDTQYADSWGNPSWFNPSNDQMNQTFPQCGPAAANLCDQRTYQVPIGMRFIFSWALYDDNYLFEMQCGTGQPWTTPQTSYGSGSETRSIGRCELDNVQASTTLTFRQR